MINLQTPNGRGGSLLPLHWLSNAINTIVQRWRGPAVEHWSLADVLSLSCARLVADR